MIPRPKPRATRKVRKQWGVFIPMWDERYAHALLRSMRSTGMIPDSIGEIAELRSLPITPKGSK